MVRTLVCLGTLLIFVLTAGAPDAQAGPSGTLEMEIPLAPRCLDPIRADDDTSRTLVANLYDRLFAYHYLHRPYQLVPSLAAGMPEVSEDGLTWTIRLRDDVVFADDACFPGGKGRALTAADVVFCFLRLMDASAGSSATWVFKNRIVGLDAFAAAATGKTPYPAVEGLKAVDERTLRIQLMRPFPELPWLLATTQTSIYPPEAVATYGETFAERAVGTGPYVLRTHIPGRSMVLAANPRYREVLYPAQGRRGDVEANMLDDAGRQLPLNNMVVLTFPERGAVAWNQFLKGQGDVCAVPHEVIDGNLDPATLEPLEHLTDAGVTLHRHPRLEIFYDAFSMKDPILGHPAGDKGRALRRAICLTTGVEWQMRALYRNAAEPVEGILLPEFPESDPTFKPAWVRQADETIEEARAAAREALEEVGYTPENPPPPLTMDILDDEGSRQAFARFQQQLAPVGIRVEAHRVAWADLRARVREGKAQMWSSYWLADYPSAQNFLQLFAGAESPDALAGGYDDPEFNDLYEAARVLPPGEKRTELYRAMQEKLTQDCPGASGSVGSAWMRRAIGSATTATTRSRPRFFEYCRVDTARRQAFREESE